MTCFVSKTIIYVGNFYFPNGSAGGTRVLCIGKALRETGYRVVFAGMEHHGHDEDRQPGGEYRHEGFLYVPENDQGNNWLARFKRGLLTHATGATTMQRLKALDLSTVQAIIVYHGSVPLLLQLMFFCRKRGLALITDCTEWYDPSQVQGGILSPIYWDAMLRMNWLQSKIGRIIAISSFLKNHYHNCGCDVIRIPPLVDMDQRACVTAACVLRKNGVLRLVYAGSPGKKDLLISVCRGLHELYTAGIHVELHLVGLTRSAANACLCKYSYLLDELGNAIIYHGRVSHPAAIALVVQADFSILVRPNERYANAGFPTKLVESLSLGVPIITNLTSDIGEYVRDGLEGIVIDGIDPESFVVGVRKVLAMPKEQWAAMRVCAQKRALQCFDYRNYAAPLFDFMTRSVSVAAGK